jgi:hypothetical protein
LHCVKPLFTAMDATPRAIKRYQNRMRYLAARLRPMTHEPDGIDSLLHWLSKKLDLRKPLVPKEWFKEPQPGQEMREPALIMLGALEMFAPTAFACPAEFPACLEQVTPGNERSARRVAAWKDARAGFEEKGLPLPTREEIEAYKAFMKASGRVAGVQKPIPASIPI